MKATINKTKIFIVGGFPNSNKKIYGGQVTACGALLESSFSDLYLVSTLDSSQISVPTPHFLIRLLFAIKRLIVFNIRMIFYRPDVSIIFLGEGTSALEKGVMVCFARLFQVPVMVFPRAGAIINQYLSKKWFAAFIRYTIGRSSTFLCQGSSFQKFAIKELGFEASTAPIIPNWTATEEHLLIGASRKYQKADHDPKILYLGHMEDSKGIMDALDAILILRDKKIKFHMIFSGKGRALARALRFVELHKLKKYVTFTGWVDQKAKAVLLDACEIFVLPSWSEGLPNSMIEAMSAGLACVLTRVGMIEDYVVNGRDALVVSPRNPSELSGAIKTLLLDQPARERISKNGSTLACSNFTLENGINLISAEVQKIKKNNDFQK